MLQPLRGLSGALGGRYGARPGLGTLANFGALVLLRLESKPKRTKDVPHRPIRQNGCAPPRHGPKKNQATAVSACNSRCSWLFFPDRLRCGACGSSVHNACLAVFRWGIASSQKTQPRSGGPAICLGFRPFPDPWPLFPCNRLVWQPRDLGWSRENSRPP